MNSFSTRQTITLNILLILLSAFVLNSFLSYKNYTLYENGKWKSTKAGLRGLFGSNATLFTKVALSENHLNIAAWFGYQEFIYNQPLKADSIYFRYHTSGPFSFILNKTDSSTQGIYFHYKNDSACCLFIADKEGKFLYKQHFNTNPEWTSSEWNDVTVKRSGDSIGLRINDHSCLNTSFKIPQSIYIGFRGGVNSFPVLIDDVKAYTAKDELIMSESFAPGFRWNWWTLVFIALSFFTTYLFLQTSFRSAITSFNMSLLIGLLATYCFYFYYLSGKYETDRNDIRWHGAKSTIETDEEVLARVRREYPVAEFAGAKPIILIIGTSQTWGAGVSNLKMTYPALVENNLRNYFCDSAITVINTGISGLKSNELYNHYTNEWHKYRPLLTVIDLSTNDLDTVAFRETLRKFIQLNEIKGIETLLIAEPNSYDWHFLTSKHNIIKSEGARYKVKTLDMQSYLDSLSESGFLWWDAFHCTDYGYRLFADRLTPEIESLFKRDSLLIKFNAALKQ